MQERETPLDSKGEYQRECLLETGFKYPALIARETFRREPGIVGDQSLRRSVMVASHLLLQPSPQATPAQLEALAQRVGARLGPPLTPGGPRLLTLPEATLDRLPQALAALPSKTAGLAYAEPDYLYFSQETPDDPSFSSQAGLDNPAAEDTDIDAPEGWAIRHSAAGIVVAVIDSGIRYTHEDIAANMWRNPGETAGNGLDDDGDSFVDDVFGADFYNEDADPVDDFGHGTHIAGIIGACGNNGRGIAGVAWETQLMSVKFLDAHGSGAASDAVRAINYAVAHGAQVLNNSWGGDAFSQAVNDAIVAAGVPFIAAAGNNGRNSDNTPSYPADYGSENIISVGNLNGYARAASSNYGIRSVDLFAPGTNIYSLGIASDSDYRTITGTSQATAFVSGIIALLEAQFPGQTAAWYRQRLLASSARVNGLTDASLADSRADLARALAGTMQTAVTIQDDPAVTRGVYAGQPLTLSVAAAGDGPLRYQWFHDGDLIAGATESTFEIGAVSVADLGDYFVVVTNASGSLRSATASVHFTSPRPTGLALVRAVATGPAPGAGAAGGLPTGTMVTRFGPPALDDRRSLATLVSLLAGRIPLTGILQVDAAGTARIRAFQNQSAMGFDSARYTSFLHPVLAPGGSLAFLATVRTLAPHPALIQGLWSDAFTGDGSLGRIVVTGSPLTVSGLPVGAELAALFSVAAEDDGLYLLGRLAIGPGGIKAGQTSVLLRFSARGATLLLRPGQFVPEAGASIASFSVLAAAPGSPGQDRWHAPGGMLARVFLSDGRSGMGQLSADGSLSLLLVAGQAAPVIGNVAWSAFGLPCAAVGDGGAAFSATVKIKPGVASALNDAAMILRASGGDLRLLAREGALCGFKSLLFSSFAAPVANANGSVAYLAGLASAPGQPAMVSSLWWSISGRPALRAYAGESASDAAGNFPADIGAAPQWSTFASLALPGGVGAGPIFIATLRGPGVTPANRVGLWAFDSEDRLRLLLRTGPLNLENQPVTLLSFTALNAVQGAFGTGRSSNRAGSVAVQAVFAGGSQALLRLDIP